MVPIDKKKLWGYVMLSRPPSPNLSLPHVSAAGDSFLNMDNQELE